MILEQLYKRNTNPNLYEEQVNRQNCGSFALNIDGWYCPYIEEDKDIDEDDLLWKYTEYERLMWIEDLVRDGHKREEIMADVLDRDFEFILMTCPWLEPITEDKIEDTDRVIAYRLSMTIPDEREEFDVDLHMDFHFRVFKDGEWWEKNGNGPIHKVAYPDAEDWEVDDWLIYDGPIRYARFKEDVCLHL